MSSEATMISLQQRVANIRDLVPSGRPVVYFDYPVHNNFGDLLIMLGTTSFLRSAAIRLADAFSVYATRKVNRTFSSDTVLLFHGGGNFGDIWSLHQEGRMHMTANHLGNRIIGLPQTLHFSSSERMDEFSRLAAKARDLHLFWRDHESFESAVKYFDCHNYLCPDMAHFLWPLPEKTTGADTLFLIRQDREGGSIPAWVKEHENRFVDWRELIPMPWRQVRRIIKTLDVIGDTAGIKTPSLPLWNSHSWTIARRMMTIFGKYELIVTSRLHAHIFASLLNKRSILIDNNYGKNSRYFESWTKASGLSELAA